MKDCLFLGNTEEGEGLVEIADYFRDRLIRSCEPEFYVAQLNEEGFENIELQKYQIVREYSLDKLIDKHIIKLWSVSETEDILRSKNIPYVVKKKVFRN